jgi:hypothetical protein
VEEGAKGVELLLHDLVHVFAFEAVEEDDIVDAVSG